MSDFLNYVERNYGCVAEYQRCMAERDDESYYERNAERWQINKGKLAEARERAVYFCEDCLDCKYYEDVGATCYDDDVTHGICHHKGTPYIEDGEPFCKGKEISRQTPCDIPEYDDKGKPHYHCPYAEDYMGYESEMCRNCCGLGVDEEIDYEERD